MKRKQRYFYFRMVSYCLHGEMVRVLASRGVEHEFDHGWFKPKTIQLMCVASTLSLQNYGVRTKTGWHNKNPTRHQIKK